MRGGLFSTGGGLFLVGGGLFPSPTVAGKSPTPARKSPTPAEKSPTAIPKRCWTLEYSGELEFSSPFMEQWTLDARGVLTPKAQCKKQKLFNAMYLDNQNNNCHQVLEQGDETIFAVLCTVTVSQSL